jgi:hypothetical protein
VLEGFTHKGGGKMLKEEFQRIVEYHATEMSRLCALKDVVTELGILEMDIYPSWGTHETNWDLPATEREKGPYIKLKPRHVMEIDFFMQGGAPTLGLVDTAPTLSEAMRLLLPKVGKFEKSYDSEKNLLKLTANFKGVRIILEDTPPETCHVEKVEYEEEIPEHVEPARTVKKVKYNLVGDCDPLLAR